jgi:hypothetical protein
MIAQSRVELSGPTDFAPTIHFAARHAASLPEDGSRYSVLLIITDGVITDIEATKEEIVKASSLPLSIIVVGVGYDSFDEMKLLDSDHQMLCSHGKYAKRDIVQVILIHLSDYRLRFLVCTTPEIPASASRAERRRFGVGQSKTGQRGAL